MEQKKPRGGCEHVALIQPVEPSAEGCEECLKMGDTWVHLRMCLVCGHVGCCDNSKNKHATKHFKETGHPIIRSFEPGENWRYCYVDRKLLV
jgi:uncharacterized UBP type Zn finger protein